MLNMLRVLLLVALMSVLPGTAVAQNPESGRAPQPPPASESDAEGDEPPPAKESAQSFSPSETIRADQAVAFPADI